MKTYKVILSGRGAEVYIHNINQNQKEQLQEMNIEDRDVVVDWDKLNEILGVENWDYSEYVYSGPYDNPISYHITVLDENDKEVFSSDDDFYMNEGESEEDYKYLEKINVLVIEHYVKGGFLEYKLQTEEDFNPELLTPVVTEINETI